MHKQTKHFREIIKNLRRVQQFKKNNERLILEKHYSKILQKNYKERRVIND